MLALLAVMVSGCRKAERPSRSDAPQPSPSADTTLGILASDSVAQSASDFTQHFYDWYRTRNDRMDVALIGRPTSFSSELLAALSADLEASPKNPNEVVGLDWDPFIANQDTCDPYRVQQTYRRGDTILVTVKGVCAILPLDPARMLS